MITKTNFVSEYHMISEKLMINLFGSTMFAERLYNHNLPMFKHHDLI